MRIPPDAVIDERKLTDYLLIARPWDDMNRPGNVGDRVS